MNFIILPTFFMLIITSTVFFAQNLSAGGNFSGGGDTECEARIQKIQGELKEWLDLESDGPQLLNLNKVSFTLPHYLTQMKLSVDTQVVCTSDKVFIGGVEKTCKFETENNQTKGPLITCNTSRFKETEAPAKYELIHHEIAGLAGLELPRGSKSKSRYDIVSDQISEYTEYIQVLKLGPKKVNTVSRFSSPIEKLTFMMDFIFNSGTLKKYINQGSEIPQYKAILEKKFTLCELSLKKDSDSIRTIKGDTTSFSGKALEVNTGMDDIDSDGFEEPTVNIIFPRSSSIKSISCMHGSYECYNPNYNWPEELKWCAAGRVQNKRLPKIQEIRQTLYRAIDIKIREVPIK